MSQPLIYFIIYLLFSYYSYYLFHLHFQDVNSIRTESENVSRSFVCFELWFSLGSLLYVILQNAEQAAIPFSRGSFTAQVHWSPAGDRYFTNWAYRGKHEDRILV